MIKVVVLESSKGDIGNCFLLLILGRMFNLGKLI